VGGHRSHGVDALRGLAVLAVFAYHALLVADLGASAWLSALYGGRFSWFFPHQLGRLGVQLFFVVSGCCIHSAMRAWAQAHPGAPAAVQWRCYALRRFWRLGPLYAATLVLTFLALHPAPATPAGATDLLVHAALLQTLVPVHINRINPSLWSLAVEVQLYALYPLVWLVLQRLRGPRASPAGRTAVLLSMALACLAWAVLAPLLTRDDLLLHLPWRWGFEWLLGVLVAECAARGRHAGGRLTLACGLAAVLVLAPLRVPALVAALPPVCLALLLSWTLARERRVAAAPALPTVAACAVRACRTGLAALGRVSYAFYLVHQPLLSLPLPAWAVLPLAVATAWLLERWARRLQRAGLAAATPAGAEFTAVHTAAGQHRLAIRRPSLTSKEFR